MCDEITSHLNDLLIKSPIDHEYNLLRDRKILSQFEKKLVIMSIELKTKPGIIYFYEGTYTLLEISHYKDELYSLIRDNDRIYNNSFIINMINMSLVSIHNYNNNTIIDDIYSINLIKQNNQKNLSYYQRTHFIINAYPYDIRLEIKT